MSEEKKEKGGCCKAKDDFKKACAGDCCGSKAEAPAPKSCASDKGCGCTPKQP